MNDDKPSVTFSGGLRMFEKAENDNVARLELESTYTGTVEPEIEWCKDIGDDEITYWPQLVFETEFGSYSISLVDQDRNLESLAAWMLDELKKGPNNRTNK